MPAASSSGRLGVALASLVAFIALGIACVVAGALARAVIGDAPPGAGPPVSDIPLEYLAAYRSASARFALEPDGWSYLAAIGKVESDHGRSTVPGVQSGQNAHGCCAGPMQIHNGFGSGGGTWGQYKTDGDGDRRLDIYDVDDAVATAASYLGAAGAPRDWRAALFAYNHAGWYVDQVAEQAAEYRRAAQLPVVPKPPTGSNWLAPLSGFPGERCDARIVPDVVALVRAFGLHVSDCFGGEPHALNGEHPLGLAIDAGPVDGDWRRTEALARSAGWTPECARSGCPEAGPFRLVLYNGYPGHGDPQHTDRPHLHLSWRHGPAAPFSRAPWVQTVLVPATARPR